MPRISDPSVTNIGALQATDSIPVDRVGDATARKTTPADIQTYLAPDYGSMWNNDAAVNISVPAIHTSYPVTSGLTVGMVRGFTFQNASELVCATTGTYLVNWSMALSNSASDQTLEGSVMVNTTGIDDLGNATRAKESAVVYAVAGTGIISLTVGDIVRLCVEKENGAASTVTINHATISIVELI